MYKRQAMYFVESEQIPTACALGVLVGLDQSVTAAGGYLIQLLPGADEEMISKIEAGVHAMGSVSHALADGPVSYTHLGVYPSVCQGL